MSTPSAPPVERCNPGGRARPLARSVLLLTACGLAIWIAGCALWPAARLGAVGFIPWQTWPPFADLRIVLEACDFARSGGDPLRSVDLLYNYPRIWLSLRHLGLTATDTPWLGMMLDLTFLACIVHFAWSAPPAATVLTAAALVTPPVMTALERANTDLVVFVLLTVCAALAATTRRSSFAVGGLALAAALKVYPAFALPVLCASGLRSARACLAAGGLIAVGLVWQISDLAVVASKTPRSDIYSYGASVPTLRLQQKGLLARRSSAATAVTVASITASAGLMIFTFRRGRRARGSATSSESRPAFSLLDAGALIFAGTFFLTSNWLYRLVFLLWCVPLLPWNASDPKLLRAARITACAIIALLWTFAWPARWGLVVSQAAALSVLALLAYLAGHLATFSRSTSP